MLGASGEFQSGLVADTALSRDAFARFMDRIGDAHAVSGIYHFEALDGGMAATDKALFNPFTFSRRGVFEYEVFNGAAGGWLFITGRWQIRRSRRAGSLCETAISSPPRLEKGAVAAAMQAALGGSKTAIRQPEKKRA